MTDLEYITNFGSSGSGNTNLDEPYGLDTDGKYLYIADKINNRVLKWTLQGGLYVTETASGDLSAPRDVLYWKDLLFIVDTGNHRIAIHRTSDLKQVKTFGSSGSGNTNFNVPTSITTDGKYLYIVDSTNNRLVKYVLRTQAFDSKKDSLGTTLNQCAYDAHEEVVYVVSQSDKLVRKLRASDLLEMDTLVEGDSTDSTFTELRGVGVKDHYIYVVEKNRIQVFDTGTFTFRATAGSDGTGNTNIKKGGYARLHRNVILFTDLTNDRVNVWANHRPARGFTSRDTRVIGGAWWQNPIIPIGGSQERSQVTIGGTAEADLLLNIEEEESNDNYANVEET